jgi:hypothetical protein
MLEESTRTYLALDNALGFRAADAVELVLAAAGVAVLFAHVWLGARLDRLAANTRRCVWLFIGLAFVLRVLLLPQHPVPVPSGADDFSYLLLGDTLAHGRLANPVHPLHQFFEAVFILQTPAYSSIFPLGQGLALAAGELLFGEPWVGVLITESLFCALCYWMLRGWLKPLWAFAGGLLAVGLFGPLSSWMNSYWGGAVAGIAGCLVFGSLPRWRETRHWRWAALAGIGLGLHLLARPFETIFLIGSVAMFVAMCLAGMRPSRRRDGAPSRTAREFREGIRENWKPAVWLGAGVMAAAILMAFHDHAVTGHWTETPDQASRYQYGVPATFTFQANAQPHDPLTDEQKAEYQAQSAVHGDGDNLAPFWARLGYRLRFVRFFLYPPLYLALAACLWRVREKDVQWALATVALFALGTNFYPYFYAHDVAALAAVLLLLALMGLEQMWGWEWRGVAWGRAAAGLLFALSMLQFVFWFGLHLFGSTQARLTLGPYETWDYLNSGDPEGRGGVERQLATRPGRHLVFVRYSSTHRFHEWIHNDAAIDQARVVRAADLGPEENQRLRTYYPDRTVWLLLPDVWPPLLMPYTEESARPLETGQPAAVTKGSGQKKGTRVSDWFEEVK